MRKRFGLILATALLAAVSVSGQRTPPVGRDPLRTSGGGISGTVQLVDCNAGPANVRITVGTRSVQPRPVEGNDFVWSYAVTGLAPGNYMARASMALGFCRGGSWRPVERKVTVSNTLAPVPNINFAFQGRRDVTRLNASLLAAAIETVFSGTTIHLNNFTSTSHPVAGRDSWHLPNDSFLSRSAAMGGGITRFPLAEVSRGPLRYYVRDFNLSRITVTPEADAFRVSIHFENNGPDEIKGKCSNTTASVDPACALGSDSTAPDYEINNARIDIRLPPVKDADGNLTYGPVRVTFEGSVEGGGLGDIFETLIKRSIRAQVEPMIMRIVDDAALRRAVARSLRPALDRAGVGTVATVRFEGRDLVIESYPR